MPTDDTRPHRPANTFVSSFREVSPQFTAAVEGRSRYLPGQVQPALSTQMAIRRSWPPTWMAAPACLQRWRTPSTVPAGQTGRGARHGDPTPHGPRRPAFTINGAVTAALRRAPPGRGRQQCHRGAATSWSCRPRWNRKPPVRPLPRPLRWPGGALGSADYRRTSSASAAGARLRAKNGGERGGGLQHQVRAFSVRWTPLRRGLRLQATPAAMSLVELYKAEIDAQGVGRGGPLQRWALPQPG